MYMCFLVCLDKVRNIVLNLIKFIEDNFYGDGVDNRLGK